MTFFKPRHRIPVDKPLAYRVDQRVSAIMRDQQKFNARVLTDNAAQTKFNAAMFGLMGRLESLEERLGELERMFGIHNA